MLDTEFTRLTTNYFDETGCLKKERLEDLVHTLVDIVKYQLGPMLSKQFDWEEYYFSLRLNLARAHEMGEWEEGSKRTQDAMQASINLFRGVIAGQAIGSKNPEHIAFAKKLCGVTEDESEP